MSRLSLKERKRIVFFLLRQQRRRKKSRVKMPTIRIVNLDPRNAVEVGMMSGQWTFLRDSDGVIHELYNSCDGCLSHWISYRPKKIH